MTLEEFTALVNNCAKDRLDFTIPNSSPEHARILIAKLFETARSEVRLLTGKLTDVTIGGDEIYAWPDVIETAIQFLRRSGSSLGIVALNPICGGP